MKDGQPDQRLLDKLGWSKDDLTRFLARWEQMKRQSQSSGATDEPSQRHLDDALRSLGLRPARTVRASGAPLVDQLRGLREGRRSTPPSEYAEQFREFRRGIAGGRGDGSQ
jgi:hypothetical protein